MSKTDNIRGYEDKKTINWVIRIYGNTSANAYKIRSLGK